MDIDALKRAIDKAVTENQRFYAFRLPSTKEIHFGVENYSNNIVTENFLIYPFQETDSTCTATIKKQLDVEEFLELSDLTREPEYKDSDSNLFTKDEYVETINDIKRRINSKEFNKIVLSNIVKKTVPGLRNKLSRIFLNLEQNNPNAFVFIYNTKETGLWLGATPETLLICKDNKATTMALAGTRLANTKGEWGNKELAEQQFVCDYISNIFEKENIQYHVSDKFTKQAGNIEHICNIITTDNITAEQTKRVINELHPTPAIAGLPKEKAIDYLKSVEKHDRKCYGGYVGIIDEDYSSCSLFVNLRSMQIINDVCHIYVGGGITIDSDPESEWNEIQRKAAFLTNQLDK